MSYVSVDHGGYSDNMTIGSFSMAFSAPLTATGCSSCCHCNLKFYQNHLQHYHTCESVLLLLCSPISPKINTKVQLLTLLLILQQSHLNCRNVSNCTIVFILTYTCVIDKSVLICGIFFFFVL